MSLREVVTAVEGSPLALSVLELAAESELVVGEPEADSLLFVAEGSGSLALDDGAYGLSAGAAALVLAGEEARVAADADLVAILVTVGSDADRHAPLGGREVVAAPEDVEKATSARSFRILLGPHNGSTRATMFAGFIPSGAAHWHYHLYDEIVWVPKGPGLVRRTESVTELGPGSAFRLRPREVHIVENTGAGEMEVVGVFTPAGSPSAAYLEPDVAAEYRFAG